MFDSSAAGSPSPPPGNSAVSSSTHPSPAFNIRSAYESAIESNTHGECWRISESERPLTLTDLLRPTREGVEEKLQLAKESNLKRLIGDFFNSSEDATSFLLELFNSGNHARNCYLPVGAVVNDLPFDSLSQSDADRAYGVFAQFHNHPNPFPSPNANNLDEARRCFSQLHDYLRRRIRKSNSKFPLSFKAPAQSIFCAGGFCTAYIPPKKDPALQNAAVKKLFLLEHELQTLDHLVKRVDDSVEDVRVSVSFVLQSGGDKHYIEEVLKQLRREQERKTTYVNHLDSLNEQISRCHGRVNGARGALLDEISSR